MQAPSGMFLKKIARQTTRNVRTSFSQAVERNAPAFVMELPPLSEAAFQLTPAPAAQQNDQQLHHFYRITGTEGAQGFPNVNARYVPDPHKTPRHISDLVEAQGAHESHWAEEWESTELSDATEKHVILSWGPS